MILNPALIPSSQTVNFFPKLSFWGKCETLYPFFYWLKFPLFIALIYGVLVFIIGIIGIIGFLSFKKNENKIIAKKRIKRALIIFVVYLVFSLINLTLKIDIDFISGGCAPHWDWYNLK